MLAGLEPGDQHRIVHHWRGADIDDVEIVHCQQVVEILDPPLDAELVGQGVAPHRVEIADGDHLEAILVGLVALDDMALADAAAHYGDCVNSAHCCQTVPTSAIFCAVSASSIALKARTCGIAVSVRLRMSAISCRP